MCLERDHTALCHKASGYAVVVMKGLNLAIGYIILCAWKEIMQLCVIIKA